MQCARLPTLFDGYTMLHISDTHVDMSQRAMRNLCQLVSALQYDVCVLNRDGWHRQAELGGHAMSLWVCQVAHHRPRNIAR